MNNHSHTQQHRESWKLNTKKKLEKKEYKWYEPQKTDETIVFRNTCSDGKTSRERNYHTLRDYGQL